MMTQKDSWLKNLYGELGFIQKSPTLIKGDEVLMHLDEIAAPLPNHAMFSSRGNVDLSEIANQS
jgi:hypothetical protein